MVYYVYIIVTFRKQLNSLHEIFFKWNI